MTFISVLQYNGFDHRWCTSRDTWLYSFPDIHHLLILVLRLHHIVSFRTSTNACKRVQKVRWQCLTVHNWSCKVRIHFGAPCLFHNDFIFALGKMFWRTTKPMQVSVRHMHRFRGLRGVLAPCPNFPTAIVPSRSLRQTKLYYTIYKVTRSHIVEHMFQRSRTKPMIQRRANCWIVFWGGDNCQHPYGTLEKYMTRPDVFPISRIRSPFHLAICKWNLVVHKWCKLYSNVPSLYLHDICRCHTSICQRFKYNMKISNSRSQRASAPLPLPTEFWSQLGGAMRLPNVTDQHTYRQGEMVCATYE